jgi:hypothetical protein
MIKCVGRQAWFELVKEGRGSSEAGKQGGLGLGKAMASELL